MGKPIPLHPKPTRGARQVASMSQSKLEDSNRCSDSARPVGATCIQIAAVPARGGLKAAGLAGNPSCRLMENGALL